MAEPAAIPYEDRRHLETPVAHARHTDPQTSKDAAKSVQHISELKLEILKAFRLRGGMRDDELVYWLRDSKEGPKLAASESSIRSRRNELVREDKLLKALTDEQGAKVKTEMNTHRAGQVWVRV